MAHPPGPTDRTTRRPLAAPTVLMGVLTLATGLIEAASLLALGTVFTACQTGNILFLAFGTVGEGGLSVVAPAASLGAFSVGAVAGARLEWALERRGRRWFVPALLVEAALVTGAALLAWDLEPVSAEASPGEEASLTAVLRYRGSFELPGDGAAGGLSLRPVWRETGEGSGASWTAPARARLLLLRAHPAGDRRPSHRR